MSIKEIQENCPYCHGEGDSAGNGMALVRSYGGVGMLYINKHTLWFRDWSSERYECNIKFCPMCGRKLSGENNDN